MKLIDRNTDDELERKLQICKLIFLLFLLVIVIYYCFSLSLSVGVVSIALSVFWFWFKFLLNQRKKKLRAVRKAISVADEPQTVVGIPAGMYLPYGVMNEKREIIAQNDAFLEITSGLQQKGIDFDLFLEEWKVEEGKQLWEFEAQRFACYCHKYKTSELDDSQFYSLCLVDETPVKQLQDELEGNRLVVALIFLDNYEEVEESLDESHLPILMALIDRKLSTMAGSVGGVLKKFEKDRYILFFTAGKLPILKEKKFDILNEIRETNIGDHIPITLSIGIGLYNEETEDGSLDSIMKNAKAAIDLALGRGGDQALIKDGEKYSFYGGKSGSGIHNSRIRARVKADALWELMGEASEVFVMGHKQADLDSLGASIGVYTIAKTLGKHCYIVMDEVSAGVKRLHQRLMETGDYDKLFIRGDMAVRMVTNRTLVVVADTHRFGMTECPAILKKAKKIVLFDHHRKSTDFIDHAVLTYHEPYASSTSEMVTEMIQYFGEKIKLKAIEADALLAGITLDTKNFCVKTGAITFEAAAFLRRNGADGVRVRLLFQNDMEAYQAKATAVKDAKIFHHDMAISVCPSNLENTTLTAAQAADDLLNVTGIRASFVSCQIQDTIYISARSFGEVNVQRIMEKLGGGGHFSVAGAQLMDMTIEEAEERMKEAITQYLEEENEL